MASWLLGAHCLFFVLLNFPVGMCRSLASGCLFSKYVLISEVENCIFDARNCGFGCLLPSCGDYVGTLGETSKTRHVGIWDGRFIDLGTISETHFKSVWNTNVVNVVVLFVFRLGLFPGHFLCRCQDASGS